MGRISIFQNTVKTTQIRSSDTKMLRLRRKESWSYLKDGISQWNKMAQLWISESIHKYLNSVFKIHLMVRSFLPTKSFSKAVAEATKRKLKEYLRLNFDASFILISYTGQRFGVCYNCPPFLLLNHLDRPIFTLIN